MTDLIFVQSYAPHGSIKGQEVLDACLMGSAFCRCAILFLGDGIYQLKKGQLTDSLSVKDYSVSYGVLSDYGVEQIICREEDLKQRGLTQSDLIIDVDLKTDDQIQSLINDSKQVLTF